MPQKILFFTIEIFTDKFTSEFNGETDPFTTQNVYQCLKELFKGTETNSSEYVEKYFSNVELNSLSIKEIELEKIDKDFLCKLKYIFDQKTNSLSLVDKELWLIFEQIIFNKVNECFDDKNKSKSLEDNAEIIGDYLKLRDLFQKKILFISIF